ncbi:hypothetical protein OSB04_015009 [Centaurea solstitialis]|uniref:PGG domain-containing protein n=1 Tax=Centaurea solstitialis TaxID=347529 RepID=A0AA38SY60_9ASTR|nr:hypothetical protein OSB04_015009 [Centaurea solstitialis]
MINNRRRLKATTAESHRLLKATAAVAYSKPSSPAVSCHLAQGKEEIEGKETDSKGNDIVSEERKTKKDQSVIDVVEDPSRKPSTPEEKEKQWSYHNRTYVEENILDGNWRYVCSTFENSNMPLQAAINNEGNTVLHLAVEKGQYNFVENLLGYHKQEEVKEALEMRNVDGSTALHVAAIMGNTNVAQLLLEKHNQLLTIFGEPEKHNELLTILDQEERDPLFKAYSSIALDFLKKFPEFARENDQVLMAIVRSFPSGLSHKEKVRYHQDMGEVAMDILQFIVELFFDFTLYWCQYGRCRGISQIAQVSYMNRIKKKEWEEAKDVLMLVCDEITHHPYYERPLLEAACQNAYEVVDEILSTSPQALRCKDEYGHDIIQLAVIHRSDKIYNRVYQIEEGKSQYYRTIKDSSDNNMLHLAGRLAPSHELNRITGAALQLQRELQWREELKKFVFPSYITQKNVDKETPGEVFTKTHGDLIKEGEKWMKTTAESCSITAGLITTIVFAAAITVPGGSNQEKGVPIFTHEIAFIIFAISDAISLFTSTITLLVFLSILTARFSEQDFLVSLPRRLIIGLCALLVSTTAMIVAFGAILFLVFCRQKTWMLIPICASVCLTIVFFLSYNSLS